MVWTHFHQLHLILLLEVVLVEEFLLLCADFREILIIFKTALRSGIYPAQWKKANVVPVHKKESKHLLNNYRPISLLPVCGKIFEKCIYNSLYSHLENNNIFSP